ncbi:UNVERIFIED_CONTAM: BAG family molecular chaperone regulator 5, mitochondrial [Sesamum latifolium]|uniref:BAG family molecular chaperone regulator 5, mitochondrial n=1 Tax=Sesamum latifolium TaxID=2727402 RepID=A0AAW2UWJ5_9LAMI
MLRFSTIVYGTSNPIRISVVSLIPLHFVGCPFTRWIRRRKPIDPLIPSDARLEEPAPKVVQIPIHFVGSGEVDRSGSALKIQKVFRGFLVRKCLRKIKDIKFQVDEIEERLSTSEVRDLVRRDERERVRMNESLMSLLFKLDSISGVDIGVRGCRKAVIRKVIALQEKIDAIVATDLVGNGEK